MNFLDTWDAESRYARNDMVLKDGSLWIARRFTQESPGESPDWGLCAHRGKKGDKGERGERGLPGAPGAEGKRGPRGERGLPGAGVPALIEVRATERAIIFVLDDGALLSASCDDMVSHIAKLTLAEIERRKSEG
jgi:hypothetical protein